MLLKSHKTFVINLSSRFDRREHIVNEFKNKPEFSLVIFEAIEHTLGSMGLWQSIIAILNNCVTQDDEYIIICEDDHQFTDQYDSDALFMAIDNAKSLQADLLLGGVSGVKSVFTTDRSLIWMEEYTGNQFLVVFKKFIPKIISCRFVEGDDMDLMFSAISSSKFGIFPFISIQKEFGYSDVTQKNAEHGRVDMLFKQASQAIEHMCQTGLIYGYSKIQEQEKIPRDDFLFPTYIFHDLTRNKNTDYIQTEYEKYKEFCVVGDLVFNPFENADDAEDFIKKIALQGIQDDDSFLILCDSRHRFASSYSKNLFIANIIDLHHRGFDLLTGNLRGDFGHAVPIGDFSFWVNEFEDFGLLVVFEKLFPVMSGARFLSGESVGQFMSRISRNKAVLHPFVSQPIIAHDGEPVIDLSVPGQKVSDSDLADARLISIQNSYRKYNGLPE